MISALRCLITYVLVPVLVPILSLGGWVAAPIGLALCAVAAVNGVVSLRRFWRADHAHRWTYTIFIAVVFLILAVITKVGSAEIHSHNTIALTNRLQLLISQVSGRGTKGVSVRVGSHKRPSACPYHVPEAFLIEMGQVQHDP